MCMYEWMYNVKYGLWRFRRFKGYLYGNNRIACSSLNQIKTKIKMKDLPIALNFYFLVCNSVKKPEVIQIIKNCN